MLLCLHPRYAYGPYGKYKSTYIYSQLVSFHQLQLFVISNSMGSRINSDTTRIYNIVAIVMAAASLSENRCFTPAIEKKSSWSEAAPLQRGFMFYLSPAFPPSTNKLSCLMETSGGECASSSGEAAKPPALSLSGLRRITSCSTETEGVMRRKRSLPGVRFQYVRLYKECVVEACKDSHMEGKCSKCKEKRVLIHIRSSSVLSA